MVKTIRTDDAVWAELHRLRLALGVRTLAQVIRHLLGVHRQHARRLAEKKEDPILALEGLGKEVWKGVNPDEYVAQLREGW